MSSDDETFDRDDLARRGVFDPTGGFDVGAVGAERRDRGEDEERGGNEAPREGERGDEVRGEGLENRSVVVQAVEM